MAKDAPAQFTLVAAMQRIGEEPFLHVGAQEGEEVLLGWGVEVGQLAAFQALQQCVLLAGRRICKDTADRVQGSPIQRSQPQTIDLTLTAVGAGQRPIHIGQHTDFNRAGRLIRRKDALEQRRRRPRFVMGEGEVGHDGIL